MDISSFAKIEVAGSDAAAFLDGLLPHRLPPTGRIGLSHLLNRRGRIEAEVTISRPAEDRFMLNCAAFFEQRLFDHLTHAVEGHNVKLTNVSEKFGMLALSGPRNPYPGKLGVIEEGAYADILLVNGNPLDDISILTTPEESLALIMKDGKIYKDTTE